jgi:bacteriocin-like protein
MSIFSPFHLGTFIVLIPPYKLKYPSNIILKITQKFHYFIKMYIYGKRYYKKMVLYDSRIRNNNFETKEVNTVNHNVIELNNIRGMQTLNEKEMESVNGGIGSLIYWGARGAIWVARNPRTVVSAGKAAFNFISKYVGGGMTIGGGARYLYDRFR